MISEDKILQRTFLRYKRVERNENEHNSDKLQAGSLSYSLAGLIAIILTLCLGTGIFTMMQTMLGGALPLIAKNYGANNQIIALIGSTIPYILNMIITPIISFRSDRTRTGIGRRMPYLLFATLPMGLLIIAIGWIEQICRGLAAIFPWYLSSYNLWVLCGLIIGYNIFYLIIGSIIYYVFPDVIPEKYIGRFMACLNLTGSLFGIIFSRYLFKLIETNQAFLFSSLAIVFMACMYFMIFSVKEGSYPAVNPNEKAPSFIGNIKIFIRDCYSLPFYYSFFLMMALSEVSMITRSMFNVLYATKQLNISMEECGIIWSWGGIASLVLCFPLGMLVDKIGSLKVFGAGLFLVIITNLAGFFWVYDQRTFLVISISLSIAYAIQMTSTLPVFVDILPKAFYGQFSSANALLKALFMTIGSYFGGLLFDLVNNYQYIFLWDLLFSISSFIFFIILYCDWKRRGGAAGYVAPIKAD